MATNVNTLQVPPSDKGALKSCLKGESHKRLHVCFQEEDSFNVSLRQEERKLMRKARQTTLYHGCSSSSKALQIMQEASKELRSDETFVVKVLRLSQRENIEEIASFVDEEVMEAKVVKEAFEEVTGFSSFAEYKEFTDTVERVGGMSGLCVIL